MGRPGRHLDAVLFDLDGVLVDTVPLHARAWQETFDELLAELGRADRFDPDGDYRRLVDGLPRADGVRSFLADRGIALPEGSRDDGPRERTVHGVGTAKNDRFGALVARGGVEPLPGAVARLHGLHAAGVAAAVVSSSRNARSVLAAAGLDRLVDLVVDGVDRAAAGVAGKPDPGVYLLAAERLGVPPGRAVVVEDAVAGVEAGRGGGFGLVVGMASAAGAAPLRAAGADLVVPDLAALGDDPDRWLPVTPTAASSRSG